MSDHETVLAQVEWTLDEVDAALVRLTQGDYGTCTSCGSPIAEERLGATPTASTCALHAGP